MHQRVGSAGRSVLLTIALLGSAGCAVGAESADAALPLEFRAACGKPGSVVEVNTQEGMIPHARCDLTGVVLAHDDVRIPVPEAGLGEGSPTMTVVRTASRDVQFKLTTAHVHG